VSALTRGERILVVVSEPHVLRALSAALAKAGYEPATAATAQEALTLAAFHPPAAVILDLLLPDADGTAVCRELRAWTDAPVIVLMTEQVEGRTIEALDAGADDVVIKPLSLDELLARLRAVLRRVAPTREPQIHVGDLRIDIPARLVTRRGQRIPLTPREFALLRTLATHKGKLLTHGTLLREIWGPAYQHEANYLHVYVSQLRRKIEPDPTQPRYLMTERGAGYRLAA
jgi:two-component system, OmpR family, KDP operon response regulator KdpE